MRSVLLFLAAPALAGCVAAAPAGYTPAGFSTYARTPDGERVRLWTDTLTGRTTGTIGGRSVNCAAGYCKGGYFDG